MNQHFEEFIEKLSENKLNQFNFEAEETFYLNQNKTIYNIHTLIKNYCYDNLLPIYNKTHGDSEIYNFILNNSTLIDNIYYKNIREEMTLYQSDNNESEDSS